MHSFFCGGRAEDISQMTRLNTFKIFIITKAAKKKKKSTTTCSLKKDKSLVKYTSNQNTF